MHKLAIVLIIFNLFFLFINILIFLSERKQMNKWTYIWGGNINYLNHDFSNEQLNSIDMRKCKKCNVEVHYDNRSGRYNTFDVNRIGGSNYPTLILTCEEYIIKNILE